MQRACFGSLWLGLAFLAANMLSGNVLAQSPSGQTTKAQFQEFLPGRYHETLEIGGKTRKYILVVPRGYDGKTARPLVMMLHGYTSNAEISDYYTGLGRKAQSENFFLVMPDGLGNPQGWNCGWINLGGAGVDDVEFLTRVFDAVEQEVRVDRKREYVVGHSNGAFMSYVMGTKLANRIAAIGVVAGTIGIDNGASSRTIDPPTKPVSAIIIHGKADRMVPYNHMPGLLLSKVYSAPDSARFWAQAVHITTPPKHIVLSATAEADEYRGPKGVEVKLVTFQNGTHDWPGGLTLRGPEKDSGGNAADLLWDFFKAHPLLN